MAIDKVLVEKGYDSHLTDQRVAITLFRNDIPGFTVEQVRVVQVRQPDTLGNHYRDCNEVYGVIGQARFVLEAIDTRERMQVEMETGDRLFVPSRTALKVYAATNTVILICSDQVGREDATHKYEIKD